jgi:rare lipoprotein A
MRRFTLLTGSALLLSGSTGLAPAFATTGRVAPADSSVVTSIAPAAAAPAATELAIREVTTPDAETVQPIRPATPTPPIATPSSQPKVRSISSGQASWYGPGFYGNRTANGEVFRPGTLTAAHRTLAFGTRVRVTNLWNGRSTIVRINDRGPFHGGRVIDLAHGAARELGVIASGVASVKLEVLQ